MNRIDSALHSLTALLREKKLLIATAESCTGGMASSFLTQLPGSSSWFERGFVTYSNLAKQEMLAVDKVLIETEGAVSEKVALAMAKGALAFSKADVSFAITGIAGPGGGSPLKPVGTICFAWAMRPQRSLSLTCCFQPSSREEIRELSCIQAFEGMIAFIQE